MATDPFDFGDTVEDFEVETDDSSAPADNNRTFMMVAGGMGLLVMLTLICFAAYAFFFAPRQKAAQQAQMATVEAQNTEIAAGLTGTAAAAAWTMTPLPSPIPTDTPAPSPTPVVVMPTDTPTPDTAYVTATIAAALTQAVLAQQTIIPTTTALPGTGFADEAGLPGLLIMAGAFMLVIFLVRRLRRTTA